eukprot:4401322-Alexandrium_andersonii.AAC.1
MSASLVGSEMCIRDRQRPPRQSLPPRDGPSTVSWVAVMACTVVMRPVSYTHLTLPTICSV